MSAKAMPSCWRKNQSLKRKRRFHKNFAYASGSANPHNRLLRRRDGFGQSYHFTSGLEIELLLAVDLDHAHRDERLAREFAAQQLVRERVLQHVLDCTA